MKLSNSAINKIGNIIRKGPNEPEYEEALKTLNEWRESHGKIMDEYFDKCSNLAKRLGAENVIVAQRLKRLPTIVDKLRRFHNMRLSSMQDIAGVRVVAKDMEQLKLFERHIKRWSGVQNGKTDDYIDEPKRDGYRGKHFVAYKDGLFVEIQLRTQLQHLWATSVETTDIFRGTSMKTDGDNTYWHDFFCQLSSIFALAENTKVISEHRELTVEALCKLMKDTLIKNEIPQKLDTMSVTNMIVKKDMVRGAYYLVLNSDFVSGRCQVSMFSESDYNHAVSLYQDLEQAKKPGHSVVLVAVNDIKEIQQAYPNYFMNLDAFSKIVWFILEKINKMK